jgi:transcription initiation factor IIF auxiliary subunit
MDPITTGALISAGGSLLSGLFNNSSANSRQEDQQAFNAEQYAKRYQVQVADMKAAGLNPMLSYGQSPGAGPSSAIASSQGMPDLGSSFSQGRVAAAQSANLMQSTNTSSAQEGLLKSQQANTDADTLGKLQIPDLIKSQVLSYTANAKSLEMGINKMEAEIQKIAADIKNIKSQEDRNKAETAAIPTLVALRQSQAFLAGKQAEFTQSQTNISDARLAGEKNLEKAEKNLGDAAAHAKKVNSIGRDFLDLINPVKFFLK